MLQKVFTTTTIPNPITQVLKRGSALAEKVNDLEPTLAKMSDAELKNLTGQFRARLAKGESLDALLVEAFAVVREASKRTIGLRHYDVQLIGGMLLHQGKIAEMRTGEGKTLMATLPLYLNALVGRGVHLVTANDYLARRDARWMAPVFKALDMEVGVLQLNVLVPTEPLGYVVDYTVETTQESTNHLRLGLRSGAYLADVTYGTSSEFGFDYLRDNLVLKMMDRVQRGHYFAIIDEVDNILIDEARTPLIISGPAPKEEDWYVQMARVVSLLAPDDVDIDEKSSSVSLTDLGVFRVEDALGFSLRNLETPEIITPEQEKLSTYLEQALRARFLNHAGKDYLVSQGKVVIVDQFTGRLVPGRRWADGLHQAVEAKEGVVIEEETTTQAMISVQNYFRMYEKLAGKSGTAVTEAEEFYKIYKLDVVTLPSRLEYMASRPGSPLVRVESKDADGYPYTYFGQKGMRNPDPVFWARQDLPDLVYRTEESKYRAIVREIVRYHVMGRPQLVGTTSVENSELLSSRLSASMVNRLLRVLLIRSLYLEAKGKKDSEKEIPLLRPLAGKLDEIGALVSDKAVSALGITLSASPDTDENIDRLLILLKIPAKDKRRLVDVLKTGVPHRVLNARRHDEEALIIAHAGAFGAVTIATNMAGRGVDIKLGGELSEETLQTIPRMLETTGQDVSVLTNEERLALLESIPPLALEADRRHVDTFTFFVQNTEQVKLLGGLHVIGTDRHEARRIDNQLRGRAARQGDPGSSRFYLSFEGDLLREFGGDRMKAFTGVLGADESVPVESKMVSSMVSETQTQVEGSNFDSRKRLLEYDDVLNMQRKRIYGQRDRIMLKFDILDDVDDMLLTEISRQIPVLLESEDGAWRLLTYLESIFPEMPSDVVDYPSFPAQVLVDELTSRNPSGRKDAADLRVSLLNLAGRALAAEQAHFLNNLNNTFQRISSESEDLRDDLYAEVKNIAAVLVADPETLEAALDQFFARLADLTREDSFRSHVDKELRLGDTAFFETELCAVVDTAVEVVALKLLSETLARRLGITLSLDPKSIFDYRWSRVVEQLVSGVKNMFAAQNQQLLGEHGRIVKDLDLDLSRAHDFSPHPLVLRYFLSRMAWDSPVDGSFLRVEDCQAPVARLNYAYLVASIISAQPKAAIQERIINHLTGGLKTLYRSYGRAQFIALQDKGALIKSFLPSVKEFLNADLLPEQVDEISSISLADLPADISRVVERCLGRWQFNEIYREYLLRLITSQWIEYLTRIEALRISVSLESFAKQDPLTLYKRKAAEMFDELIADIRATFVRSMFRFQITKEE